MIGAVLALAVGHPHPALPQGGGSRKELLLQGGGSPTFLETPVAGAEEIAFAAFAPLPKEFGEKDRQRLAVAVRTLANGSQEYSRRGVFEVTDGRTVGAALLPDGVLVRFVVPSRNLVNGVALMEGLLRRPSVTDEALGEALRRLQRGEPDYWVSALRPGGNSLRSLRADEARALLARTFNPTRTVVAAVGGFAAGDPEARWRRRTADWRPVREPRYPDISPTPEPKDNPAGITSVELRGAAFPATDPLLAARWLALLALGVGKGGALFRDVRQVEGWSYRQEAILWPDRAGLVPRLVAAAAPEAGEAGRAEGLRATLLKGVAGLTEGDRERALGVAGLGLGPLWLFDGPVGDSPLDRASLDAYWWSKAGVRWDWARLEGAMREVPLDELKRVAEGMVRDARAIVTPGRVR